MTLGVPRNQIVLRGLESGDWSGPLPGQRDTAAGGVVEEATSYLASRPPAGITSCRERELLGGHVRVGFPLPAAVGVSPRF